VSEKDRQEHYYANIADYEEKAEERSFQLSVAYESGRDGLKEYAAQEREDDDECKGELQLLCHVISLFKKLWLQGTFLLHRGRSHKPSFA